MTSLASSRTRVDILDQPSSEKLAGKNDVQDVESLPPQEEPPTSKPGPPGPPGPPSNPDLYQPKTLKFWLILLSNFLALFLVALDRTIVATAIPRITDEFGSLRDIGWYGSAYMLTTSASQLVFGRVYKFYNMKWYVVDYLACSDYGPSPVRIWPDPFYPFLPPRPEQPSSRNISLLT